MMTGCVTLRTLQQQQQAGLVAARAYAIHFVPTTMFYYQCDSRIPS